jgi:two-component system, cell cycle sensor histidine kinase and response regulator CckA
VNRFALMTARFATTRDRAVGLAAGLVALHGAWVLVGWAAAWPLFVSPPPTFIPMAPSTALALLLLGLAVLLEQVLVERPGARRTAATLAWLVAAAALLNVAAPGWLDAVLGGATGAFGRVRLGVMSPVTALALLPLALALGWRGPGRRYAGVGAAAAAAIGAIVALGYAYGRPLLYGGAAIPVALSTGLSLLLLGCAIVAAAGPERWPLRPLVGPSPRARMLRAFLPATAGLVVLLGLLDARFGSALGANGILLTAWLAVAGVALVTLLVSRLARRLGAQLEAAYAERQQAEQRYRQVFEQMLAGVATTTLGGEIVLCNDAFARVFGYESAEALVGRRATDLFWSPEERDRILVALQENGQLRDLEIHMRHREGKPVWVLANLTLRPSATGDARIESTLVDISDRKALEQRLWQAQKLDALGSLAGGVAHDFNNLLTAIVGYAGLLRDEFAPDDRRLEDLQEIDNACQRAAALTRQLLAFSRRQPFAPKALHLDDTVQDMAKMLGRLIGPQIRLVTATDDALAPAWVDPTQIEQVVLNLAVNSRDAMPKGGTLTIETRNLILDAPYREGQVDVPPGPYVLLAVSDTGTGMDKETLGRLFEPFFTTKEKGKGTGLGLATVYGIVKQSRGHILVYSEPGVGTTFKCYFPVSEVDVGPAIAAAAPERVAGQETVLVIEDEPAILGLVVSALTPHGYRVLPAADGEAAMRFAATHDGEIDLVLSDGVLSGVRVPELLRRLQAERPETKILLMSGYSQEAVFQNEIVDPSTAFLAKPFSIRQLTQRVREVLDAPSSPKHVGQPRPLD